MQSDTDGTAAAVVTKSAKPSSGKNSVANGKSSTNETRTGRINRRRQTVAATSKPKAVADAKKMQSGRRKTKRKKRDNAYEDDDNGGSSEDEENQKDEFFVIKTKLKAIMRPFKGQTFSNEKERETQE